MRVLGYRPTADQVGRHDDCGVNDNLRPKYVVQPERKDRKQLHVESFNAEYPDEHLV